MVTIDKNVSLPGNLFLLVFNQSRQGMVNIGITNEFENEILIYNQYTNKCKINATITGSRYSKE